MSDEPFVEEFLYRGRHESEGKPPAWHIVMASVGVDKFGRPYRDVITMNMRQAIASKWSRPKALRYLNVEVLAECEDLRDRIASLEHQMSAASAALAENADLKAKIAAMEASNAA